MPASTICQLNSEVDGLEDGHESVSITRHGDDTACRGSTEGFDVKSTTVHTLTVQNQIKASSDMNVISSGCDLEDKILQPVKQPLGCTR